MPLRKLLVDTKPRERSGSISANRFEFQKSWALCKLLELHKSNHDYLLVLDFHDDILILDSSHNPDKIDFYQIKTASKAWTRAGLTRREKVKGSKSKGLSILGKLIGNKLAFPGHARTLSLVSNQSFHLIIKGGATNTASKIRLAELDDKELRKILDALKIEHALSTDPECESCSYLEVTELSVLGHADHALGKLAQFVDELYPGKRFPLAAIYRTLADDIKRKTTVEPHPESFDVLKESRGISRESFDQFLKKIKPSDEFDAFVLDTMNQLRFEGAGIDEQKQLRDSFKKLEIDRMNSANTLLRRAWTVMTEEHKKTKENGKLSSRLRERIAMIVANSGDKTAELKSTQSDGYLNAMAAMIIHEY